MTGATNARIAGATFLVYIASSIASMFLFTRATTGADPIAQLAGIAAHTTDVRLTIMLGLLQSLSALVLAVTLWALTKAQDPVLAMLALACRVAEGVGGMDMSRPLGLLWLATAAGTPQVDAGAAAMLGGLFLTLEGAFSASATFFAVGSLLFSWLLLRGRMIPAALGWLGVVASAALVVCLPPQLAGLLRGPITSVLWVPMLAFEVVLALWLLVRGVAAPAPKPSV